ncbi:flavin reductase family protein [Actinomadura roseirufa]|uniref:flavin reductase family protein n=1 Tax=Actinomadura roseirufa TaxID=2094049 RepID=UPI001041528E|nr:flavin reductase family protein [Actinomadura roseirufa]
MGLRATALTGDPAARPPDRGTEPGTREPPGDPAGAVDGARFRSVLGRFATGVVAITAIEPGTGRPAGLAANSFTSVSLDPPLVAFCVAHTSSTWPRLRDAGRLCVNILGEPQLEVSKRLATRGGDKFAGIDWTESPGGGPLIEGALAWIECTIDQEHTAGDHVIVVARVHALDTHEDTPPLLFYRGSYGGLRP